MMGAMPLEKASRECENYVLADASLLSMDVDGQGDQEKDKMVMPPPPPTQSKGSKKTINEAQFFFLLVCVFLVSTLTVDFEKKIEDN